MFSILTYVRVAPATADVHFILQEPATDHDNIHIEDRYGLAKTKSNNGIYNHNTQNSQLIRT